MVSDASHTRFKEHQTVDQSRSYESYQEDQDRQKGSVDPLIDLSPPFELNTESAVQCFLTVHGLFADRVLISVFSASSYNDKCKDT